MSDVARKVLALSILIIGGGLLWAGRRSYQDAKAAKNEMDSTVASAKSTQIRTPTKPIEPCWLRFAWGRPG